MRDLLSLLLGPAAEPASFESVGRWWENAVGALRWEESAAGAVAGGFAADRLGLAFAAGYRCALRALVPDLATDRLVAFCATEEGGAHPRAIETRLTRVEDGYVLEGSKEWSTLALEAEWLLVVASVGTDVEGRNRLKVARVGAAEEGVSMTAMPPPPFAPEIVHARVTFEGVPVAREAVLAGDGFDDFLKPFRTVEDVHVQAALLGYVAGVARRHGWPQEAFERLLALVAAVRSVAALPPAEPGTHVVLAGLIEQVARALDGFEDLWDRVPEAERARWRRDRPLLDVAGNARAARRARAWQRLQTAR